MVGFEFASGSLEKESIVIKSSIERIYKALNILNNNTFNIDIGEVEYVNFHNTILEYKNHILEPLFYKDIEYKYEQELRIIVWKRPENNILNTNHYLYHYHNKLY